VSALVIALGTGGAYAAGKIHSHDLAKGAVTKSKLHDNAVTSAKIKDHSVKAKDLQQGLVRGQIGPRGPRGFSAWDAIPSGTTVTGFVEDVGDMTPSRNGQVLKVVSLPGIAPASLDDMHIGFGHSGATSAVTVSPGCSGSSYDPTAAPGYVCIYLTQTPGLHDFDAGAVSWALDGKQNFLFSAHANADAHWVIAFVWAYTAP